ncbi:hypothetical protein [Blastococcus sp. SYSU DS0539]
MTLSSPAQARRPDRTARLGRALIYIHHQEPLIREPLVSAAMETLLVAGRSMDFASRLRGHGRGLTGDLATQYAAHAGIGTLQLRGQVLPALKTAGIVDYRTDGAAITHIEEYVGVSAPLVTQAMQVLDVLSPSVGDLAVLHSVELAAWAPLTVAQHAQSLVDRGFTDEQAREATRLGVAAGINNTVASAALNEKVIYNPNVWGSASAGVDVATFLRSLPPAERESLLGIAEQASARPALAVAAYGAFDPSVLRSATKVGLVQAATVTSSYGGAAPQTYVFSPIYEPVDDTLVTTEALHLRKLFVAHILYGHEKAAAGRGQISDPAVLVDRLLRRGRVGPASNIASDYRLLERAGIVSVSDAGNGRAFLHAVKNEIIEGGLGWLQQSFGEGPGGDAGDVGLLRPPAQFSTPESERAQAAATGAANEISDAAVLKLREAVQEAQRVARHEY